MKLDQSIAYEVLNRAAVSRRAALQLVNKVGLFNFGHPVGAA